MLLLAAGMASQLFTRFLRSNFQASTKPLWNWKSLEKVSCAIQSSSYTSGTIRVQSDSSNSEVWLQKDRYDTNRMATSKDQQINLNMDLLQNWRGINHRMGKNVSRKDKAQFLMDTLTDLKESKEAVYDALDAWVAWEEKFPIVTLRRALITLEKEQQWHRIIQVIKWMLSKGQGATMGTYKQLICALDKENRVEEAHRFWGDKVGHDLHSVPWQLCDLMISIYYRNNMLERLVKLFKGLESFDRKPPNKATVQKVADVHELLGLPEEQKRLMDKYNYLFSKLPPGKSKKSKASNNKISKAEQIKDESPEKYSRSWI